MTSSPSTSEVEAASVIYSTTAPATGGEENEDVTTTVESTSTHTRFVTVSSVQTPKPSSGTESPEGSESAPSGGVAGGSSCPAPMTVTVTQPAVTTSVTVTVVSFVFHRV